MTFLTMLPVILVSMLDDTALYSKCDRPSNVCHQPDLAPEFEFGLQDTQDLYKKWLNTLNARETQLDLFDCLNSWCYWRKNWWVYPWCNIALQDASTYFCKMSGNLRVFGVFRRYKMGRVNRSLIIVSIAKTDSKNIGVLIRSVKFLSFEVLLCLCKPTIHAFT